MFSVASVANAQVPFTFNPGQPARASEVNSNFKYLDDRITSMKGSGAPPATVISGGNSAPMQPKFIQVTQTRRPLGCTNINAAFPGCIIQYQVPRFGVDEIWLIRYLYREGLGHITVNGKYLDNSFNTDCRDSDWYTTLNGFTACISERFSYDVENITTAKGLSAVAPSYTSHITVTIYLDDKTSIVLDSQSTVKAGATLDLSNYSSCSSFISTWDPANAYSFPIAWGSGVEYSKFGFVFNMLLPWGQNTCQASNPGNGPVPLTSKRETDRVVLRDKILSSIWLEKKP
jgi:hypothetical protein